MTFSPDALAEVLSSEIHVSGVLALKVGSVWEFRSLPLSGCLSEASGC